MLQPILQLQTKHSDGPKTEALKSFRPIHYLGSKLRMLEFIEDVINDIAPQNSTVCDLFTGSGSVAFYLAMKRPVLAADIQEYSRVICSALLKNTYPKSDLNDFIYQCRNSRHTKKLEWCFEPMIQYEDECIVEANKGTVEPLCNVIENGSLILRKLCKSKIGSKALESAMQETFTRLRSEKLETGSSALISQYYGGVYFSYKQAIQIDAALEQIQLTGKDRDLFLAALLSTTSNIVNTVGKQFAQPIRPRNAKGEIKPRLGDSVNRDRSLNVFEELEKWCIKYYEVTPAPYKNKTLRMDYSMVLDQLPPSTKVIYADPPYTRDHYSRYYHILETICLRDSPKLSTMVLNGQTQISRGLYREDRHQSPFCIKKQAPEAFATLISKSRAHKCSLVLSYSPYDESKNSHPRLMKMEQLLQLTQKYYGKVEVLSPGEFVHSKLTNSEKHLDASVNAEALIVCRL